MKPTKLSYVFCFCADDVTADADDSPGNKKETNENYRKPHLGLRCDVWYNKKHCG